MLHLGEIQDDGGEGDKDQVEESQGGDKVCGFTKIGTSKKHLKQDLERRETLQPHIKLTGPEASLHVFLP